MSGGRFDTLLNQVQGRIEALENISKDFPKMPTLDQKRQSMARSKRDFTTMNNNLAEMERLIQTMPVRDREFFAGDLASCRESISELKRTFEALDVQLQKEIKEEEEKMKNGGDLDAELVESTRRKMGGVLMGLNDIAATSKDTIKAQEQTKSTLQEDRSILGNVNNNAHKIDDLADSGLKKAGRMLKRAICTGCLTWTINVLLMVALGVIIAWKLHFIGGDSSEE